MNSNNILNKHKKKLALGFTLSIFVIVIIIQGAFMLFKFYDYKFSQFARLDNQAKMLENVVNSGNIGMLNILPKIRDLGIRRDFENNFGDRKDLNNDIFAPKDIENFNPRGIRSENFILYRKLDSKIIFTSIDNENDEIKIVELIKNNNGKKIISIDGIEFYFVNKSIGEDYNAIFLVESRFKSSDLIIEFLEYVLLFSVFGFLLYFAILRFINHSFKPVEQSFKNMEEFIFAAGHELKTPLSVLDSKIELEKLKNNISDNLSKDLLLQTNKLNNLIENLINLSTIARKEELEEKIKVSTVLNEVIELYKPKAKENKNKISLEILEDFDITANKDYLKILFGNLLNNAIKYSQENKEIKILVNKNSIKFIDNGIGINEENLSKIFDSFFQASDVRVENSFGIGLTLVKKITDLYLWKVLVKSKIGEGSEFEIKF